MLSGLDGVSVIAEDDAIHINALSKAQDTKAVYQHLEKTGRPETNAPVGEFDVTSANAWFRDWAFSSALPLWWSLGFDHEIGLWREGLTISGDITSDDCRARVQPRQTFAYAAAGNLGWRGPARQAVAAGFQAIDEHFADDKGLLRHLCTHSGDVTDARTFAYDQTFLLLALAEASELQPDAEAKALNTLNELDRPDRIAVREVEHPPHQSNPNMHLFEACLAWMEVEGSNIVWRETADGLARLAAETLLDSDSGFILEFFEDDWRPRREADRPDIEPGHQFEWAWLLTRYADLTQSVAMLDLAVGLFQRGLNGVDPASGFVVTHLNDNGRRITTKGRFWHQIEWLKACLILADRVPDRREEYLGHAATAFNGIRAFLDHPVRGLWFDQTESGQIVPGPAPASTFYHLMSLAQQLEKSARAAS